jgi:hypothetical protein
MINTDALKNAAAEWRDAKPFPHFHIDDFFEPNIANQLEAEMPNFDSDIWHEYGNAIEVKKVCNNWNVFPSVTYRAFSYLNSNEFVSFLGKALFEDDILSSDFGLNGGGWHIHSRGGKLNTHLDYSLHPKTRQQRKLNIIVYLNSEWEESWGGALGLWGNESDKAPGPLVKQIVPKFNRAVIFDTTCNSWHGLPDPIDCPEDKFRKSLAVYYLTSPSQNVDTRGKALFAPTEDQKNDAEILNLIERRSQTASAASVWSVR